MIITNRIWLTYSQSAVKSTTQIISFRIQSYNFYLNANLAHDECFGYLLGTVLLYKDIVKDFPIRLY